MPSSVKSSPASQALPGSDGTIDENLVFGKDQLCRLFRVFSRQYSQPELILLSKEVCKVPALHSSQISGLQKNTLKEPSPKLFLIIGELNLAIARSQGIKGLPKGPKCPSNLKHLWDGKLLLRNLDGSPMGPVDVFKVFSGLVDMKLNSRNIPSEIEQSVSKSLGKYLRLKLSSAGIDWFDEMDSLKKKCSIIEDLVLGKTVSGDSIVPQLPALAELCKVTEDEIWDSNVASIVATQLGRIS